MKMNFVTNSGISLHNGADVVRHETLNLFLLTSFLENINKKLKK